MKYQIMVNILLLLLGRKKITAREIANRYDISIRSVYRYVEELNVSGIPIDVARGRYGGISISDTFKLPTGYFSAEEYNAAINALHAFTTQVNDENALSALEKLERQHKTSMRELTLCGNIIVDGGGWADLGKFSENMKACERAVNECLCLDIDYISRSGERTKRIIDPHVLIFKQNVWYVYAFCHTKQEFRTFKIGRIKRARFTGKSFIKKEINRNDIPLNFYFPSEQLIDVKLEINKQAAADIEEWLGIDNIDSRGDKLVANVSLPDDEQLVEKLLSFGGKVKVLAPENLRKKIKTAAQEINNLY
jgi:predicted DNA-binding transcriptional regulator YafY